MNKSFFIHECRKVTAINYCDVKEQLITSPQAATMASRKVANELNELLKESGNATGTRRLGVYRKNRQSSDLSDNASQPGDESKCDDDSKGEKDDLEGKSSKECSGGRSEASELTSERDSKTKAASPGSKSSSESVSSSSESDDDDSVDKEENVKVKGDSGKAEADEPNSEDAKQGKSGNNNEGSVPSQIKKKVWTRPAIGPELLPKPDRSRFSDIQSKQSESTVTKRSSCHEQYTRKEISDFNSNFQVKEAESADVNSNVKKVPMIGRMGFSLDLNKELNAKFAAAKLQMTGTKKQVPITTTPTENKNQPPVPLSRPRQPEGKTSFEVKRERSKRGLLVDPEEPKEEKIEGSSKFVDLDTGHIYEDIDLYQTPPKCEACKKERVESGEESKDIEGGKKGEKKKKKSKLRMLCMCRQTSNDPPSAGLGEKTDSKICLLAGENRPSLITSETSGSEGDGYEKLQRQKSSFRGGYEPLRNYLPEDDASKSPPEGAMLAGAVVKKREFKNESTKSEAAVSSDSSFSNEQFHKHFSKESSFESKIGSTESKSVRFAEKTENIVEESSEEHLSTGSIDHKLGLNTKRNEVTYAKVMKTSHKSEHSKSVVEATEMESNFKRGNRLQRFGAVPVFPLEGKQSIWGRP